MRLDDLFKDLPTDLARKLRSTLDQTIAEQIAQIEPITPAPETLTKFLQVVSSPRAPRVLAVTWKGQPIVRVVKHNRTHVSIDIVGV